MTGVLVAGAAGRMGKRIVHMVLGNPGLTLAGAFEQPDSPEIGRDAGELAGSGRAEVSVSAGLDAVIDKGDVLIDFTHHLATMAFARQMAARGKAMVIGTTGLSRENLDELRGLAAGFACVQSPNMAVGVNVTFKVAEKLAALLGRDYDMEIVEAHHRLKKDAPSGTALRLGEMMAAAAGRDLEKVGVYARHGMIGQRSDQEIGIQTIRGGDIVGEHTVYFAGAGERIELSHRAHSRDNFARGATLAASWVAGRAHGLYNMFDVLGLNDF